MEFWQFDTISFLCGVLFTFFGFIAVAMGNGGFKE